MVFSALYAVKIKEILKEMILLVFLYSNDFIAIYVYVFLLLNNWCIGSLQCLDALT